MICGSGGSKSRLAKAAGAESPAQMRTKNCTPLWREARFQVKMIQNVQKHTRFGPLLEVGMWKNGTPLWREKTFSSQRFNRLMGRTIFGNSHVEKWHAVVARSTFASQNVHTIYSRATLEVRMSKDRTAQWPEAHVCTKHQPFGAILEFRMSKKCLTDEMREIDR